MKKNNITKGIALSFVSLLLLGVMPIISNSRPLNSTALNFALYLSFWELVFAAPVFLLEYRFINRGILGADLPSKMGVKTAAIMLFTGILFGLSTYFYVLSMEKAGTVSASIAIQAYPLFVILWETIFLKKKKSKAELFFTFLLVVSLYYLGTNGSWQIDGISYWTIFSLSVPLIWSVAHVLLKEVIDKTPITPAQVTFFRVLVSATLIFVIAVFRTGWDPVLGLLADRSFQIFAVAMGFVYYLELVNWFYAVKFVDVSLASSITTPWPAVTLLLAIIFLNESVEVYQAIALILVSICVYGILLAGKKKRGAEAMMAISDQ